MRRGDFTLAPGVWLNTLSGQKCQIREPIGQGAQGEVYLGALGQKTVAVKWYYPRSATRPQRELIERLIAEGFPSPKFLWPMHVVGCDGVAEFGYVMPFMDGSVFKGLESLVNRSLGKDQKKVSFRTLATLCFDLADQFHLLHSRGWCYRDISFGNVAFDPNTGDVMIADTDNVSTNNDASADVCGTPKFMAPEIVRGEARPNTGTDLHSLAVLLFYILINHHPLEGARELAVDCPDEATDRRLYGVDPLFIYDPKDSSNRPDPVEQPNADLFWWLLPQYLRDRFTQAFTDGLTDPRHGRVTTTMWRQDMVRLRDSLIVCRSCERDNPPDSRSCWQCRTALAPPSNLVIQHGHTQWSVALNLGTRLFPHHVDPDRTFDFANPVAEVTVKQDRAGKWGLTNRSDLVWRAVAPNGRTAEVAPGRTVGLGPGLRVLFGRAEGEVHA